MISKLNMGNMRHAESEAYKVIQLEKLELKNSYDYKALANHNTKQYNCRSTNKQTKKAMFPKSISSALPLLPISYFRISAKLVLRGLLKNSLGRSSKFIFLGPSPEILSHWVWGVSQVVFLNHTLILVPSFICLFIQQTCEFILCIKFHNFIPNT